MERGRPKVDNPKRIHTFRLSDAELEKVNQVLSKMRERSTIQKMTKQQLITLVNKQKRALNKLEKELDFFKQLYIDAGKDDITEQE